MGASRGQFGRLIEMDGHIRTRQYPSVEFLAQELEVSKSTIRRDIRFLRDQMSAPLVYDRSKRGYYYSKENFVLPGITLTEGEVLALLIAEQVLYPLEKSPLVERMQKAMDRLYEYLPEKVQSRLWDLAHLVSYATASMGQFNVETFSAVYDATLNNRQISVTYHSVSSGEVTHDRILNPYHLGNMDGSWFLFAHCQLREDVRMFNLGRLSRVQKTGRTFRLPADFSPEQYLEGGFRVLVGTGDYQVRIRFTRRVAPYVLQKKWHSSQELEEQGDGSVVATLQLNTLEEVASWVLSFGGQAKVLQPSELRDRVRTSLQRALQEYDDDTG